MWYLSGNQSLRSEQISRDLIAKNGWRDQFAITSKILLENYIMINDMNMAIPARKPSRYDIIKGIVDILFCLQHPINELNISWDEIESVAFNDYEIDGKPKPAKVPRTYQRILNIDNYQPTQGLQPELSKLAHRVIKQQQKEYGPEYGLTFQTNRTKEEYRELVEELDKYTRFQDTVGTKDALQRKDCDNRMAIVDEIYDVLYTPRYLMIKENIKISDIQKLFEIRLKEINFRQFGR